MEVYGGACLLVFGLFMLSLAQPKQFYQVLPRLPPSPYRPLTPSKVFLAQGVCMGVGAGLLYIPSIAVIAHYFRARRVLAMALVAAGSSLGSVVHPIMLNNLFGRLGFANTVRASAGLVAGMLLIASLLMKERLPPPTNTPALLPALRKFSRDRVYVLVTLGYATPLED